MPAFSRVIQARVVPPPLPPTVVSRPRLEELLSDLIDEHPVVCVYATPGAGKTTAVLQTADRKGWPMAWLSVEATDAATGRLLSYLEAAVARCVPSVAGLVADALAAGAAHEEVAGLLAEAIGDEQILVVVDNLERLEGAEEAAGVLRAFCRYLPTRARAVLVSRSALPVLSDQLGQLAAAAEVGEVDLAFTVDEAHDALHLAGHEDIDPERAVEMTGGWVAGVLFEAWRSDDHVVGASGAADPLHGYLASQIIDQLPPEDREFLTATSVLDHVTVRRARQLGLEDAAARLNSLRARHLPVSWDRDVDGMRCHPRFREYLLERLGWRQPEEVRALRVRHGALLAMEGHHEEAVEEYLLAGALEDAMAEAGPRLATVIDRADLAMAERWLKTLAPVGHLDAGRLATAELMLAVAREDYRLGAAIADRLEAEGERDPLARSSSRAGAIMGWCYLHTGRLDDLRHLVAITQPGRPVDAMRYCLNLVEEEPAPVLREASFGGGPFDALIMRTDYYAGRWWLLTEEPSTPWAAKAAASWRIGALLAMGHIDEANRLFQETRGADRGAWFSGMLAVKLFASLERRDEALKALLQGRDQLRERGSTMLELQSFVEEADLALRLDRSPGGALQAIARFDAHPVAREYRFIAEQADTWRGLALLQRGERGDDVAAARCLRAAVRSAVRGQRLLCLPAAAVFLAEAEWRTGDEDAADEAADLALAAADQQRTDYPLLQALALFPAALSRRLDAEPSADSRWHELGRALLAQRVPVEARIRSTIVLREFGGIALTVDGREVNPKITKSYELLAYLALAPGHRARRTQLVDALFAGRADESTSAYLRQAVLKLRQAAPEVVHSEPRDGWIGLAEGLSLTTESLRFEGLLAEAATAHGPDRLDLVNRALELAERGDYLPKLASPWVDERRAHLGARVLDARIEASELHFDAGQYEEAERLLLPVLEADPYRERAWRLLMRIASAFGDEDRVIVAYRDCERALAELRSEPSRATRQLFGALRA